MVGGRDNAWNRAPGPHAHTNTARQAIDGLWTEARGQHKNSQTTPATTSTSSIRQLLGAADGTPCHIQHSPNTGLRERGNDTSKSTGRSGWQKAATRRNIRREERVTVQGPVKEQQPDGMSHRGAGLCLVFGPQDRGGGGYEGKKKFVYLKCASHFLDLSSKLHFLPEFWFWVGGWVGPWEGGATPSLPPALPRGD